MSKYFIVDVETGGLPEKNVSLLTVYAMVVDSNTMNRVNDSIELKIKPDNGVYCVEPRAMEINKIDLVKHDKEAIPFSQAKELLLNFIVRNSLNKKLTIVGHSVDFDISFLKKMIGKDEWPLRFNRKILDTKSLANFLCICGVLPRKNVKQCGITDLAKYFDLPYDGVHDAKFDAELTKQILVKLIETTKKLTIKPN